MEEGGVGSGETEYVYVCVRLVSQERVGRVMFSPSFSKLGKARWACQPRLEEVCLPPEEGAACQSGPKAFFLSQSFQS